MLTMSLQRISTAALLSGALALGACSNMNTTEKRTLGGAGIGAAAGAVIGATTGAGLVTSTIVGGALGAGAGYLYDQDKKGKL